MEVWGSKEFWIQKHGWGKFVQKNKQKDAHVVAHSKSRDAIVLSPVLPDSSCVCVGLFVCVCFKRLGMVWPLVYQWIYLWIPRDAVLATVLAACWFCVTVAWDRFKFPAWVIASLCPCSWYYHCKWWITKQLLSEHFALGSKWRMCLVRSSSV